MASLEVSANFGVVTPKSLGDQVSAKNPTVTTGICMDKNFDDEKPDR
jgi:hypothetical protein